MISQAFAAFSMFAARIGAWTFNRGIVLTTHIDNFKFVGIIC